MSLHHRKTRLDVNALSNSTSGAQVTNNILKRTLRERCIVPNETFSSLHNSNCLYIKQRKYIPLKTSCIWGWSRLSATISLALRLTSETLRGGSYYNVREAWLNNLCIDESQIRTGCDNYPQHQRSWFTPFFPSRCSFYTKPTGIGEGGHLHALRH